MLRRYRILWLTLAIALCASLVLGQAQNFFNATQLQGVNISQTAPTNGQVLGYVSATKLWTPSTAAGGGGLSGMTAGQVPIAATATTVTSSEAIVGTDTSLLSAGTVTGTAAPLCVSSNGGATTSGCTPAGGVVSSCSGTTPGIEYVCSTPISSAQILADSVTSVVIVAAPGSSKVIVPISGFAQYKFVTTAYTGAMGAGFFLNYGTLSLTTAILYLGNTGLVDQTVNAIAYQNYTGESVVQTLAVNTSLNLGSMDALTLGDGTLVVTVWYTVLALS